MWRQSYLVHTNSSCIVKKSRNIFLFNVLSGRKSSLPPLQSFLRETFLSGFMAYFILILNLLYIYLLSLGPFCVDSSIKLWIRILIIWEYGKHIHTYNKSSCVFSCRFGYVDMQQWKPNVTMKSLLRLANKQMCKMISHIYMFL